MILTREIDIKITEKNIDYFESLGYDNFIGDIIRIPTELLNRGSTKVIDVECDSCGVEKSVIYKNYLKYKNDNWGEYKCRKCSESKRKEKLLENWGVEYPYENSEILNNVIKMRSDKTFIYKNKK
jgi:DNA-directed RNA polymerase subunit N (RpoN/RPB10)